MLLMTHNTFWSVPNAVCATANGGIVSVGNSAVRVTREVLLIKGFCAHDHLKITALTPTPSHLDLEV